MSLQLITQSSIRTKGLWCKKQCGFIYTMHLPTILTIKEHIKHLLKPNCKSSTEVTREPGLNSFTLQSVLKKVKVKLNSRRRAFGCWKSLLAYLRQLYRNFCFEVSVLRNAFSFFRNAMSVSFSPSFREIPEIPSVSFIVFIEIMREWIISIQWKEYEPECWLPWLIRLFLQYTGTHSFGDQINYREFV